MNVPAFVHEMEDEVNEEENDNLQQGAQVL